jgi:isocitrate dehydrogenase
MWPKETKIKFARQLLAVPNNVYIYCIFKDGVSSLDYKIIGWLIKNELEITWMKTVLAWFKVLSSHLPEDTEKKHTKLQSG